MATGTITKVVDENNLRFPDYLATPTTVTSTGTVRKTLDNDAYITAYSNIPTIDGSHAIAIGTYVENLTATQTMQLYAKKGTEITLYANTSYASIMKIYPLL